MKKLVLNTLILILLISMMPSFKVFAAKNCENNEEKIIYLTFDDGPSTKVLPDILDTLEKEDVKGTFFIIGNEIKGREDILKRIHKDGHSIGLHSFTHEKKKLYSSNEEFLNEMLKTQSLINDIVHIKPTILRFPFGCNNTYYKLNPSLINLLHKNNLKVYDWNVDSGDGTNHKASPNTYVKNSKSNKNSIILLMHCGTINKNSAKALPEIISYYKSKGYVFKKITSSSPEYFNYIK